MPPSDSAIVRSGKFLITRDHRTSAAACTMFMGCRVIMTSMGASTDVITSADEEPMCRQTTVPSSEHAFQNGSQYSEWKLGCPSFSGFSEKVTAWHPFLATRRTSSAMRLGSQMGGSDSGMKRPGYVP